MVLVVALAALVGLAVAAGVVWEVIEFLAGELTAFLGTDAVLVQYGLRDTMTDLVFDVAGGVVVALWGAVYLPAPADDLTAWLDERRGD